MSRKQDKYTIELFCSYCHKDEIHRKNMEDALSPLKSKHLLVSWSDHNILPGEGISDKVRQAMDGADIIVFLFSQRFIASMECMKEWNYSNLLSKNGTLSYRIPIVLSNCAWLDILDGDPIKALPNDGKPVSTFPTPDEAWQQVYQGVKKVVETLRSTSEPKVDFINGISTTEFISNQKVDLRKIFVFPTLLARSAGPTQPLGYDRFVTEKELCQLPAAFVHGEEVSGKTALARHLFFSFLSDIDATSVPLYIDLNDTTGPNPEHILATAYSNEYTGDFSIWKAKGRKILILENMSPHSRSIKFLICVKRIFQQIFVTLSTDIYHSFFLDDARFADFMGIKIEPLNHSQQEKLIRNMLEISKGNEQIPDGLVDQYENKVNSIIVSNKIVPRYPFYVLSILQSQEQYMPDVSITSYGHCYYVLIVAHLIKSGVSSIDMDLNACFNFLEHLAFDHYLAKRRDFRLTDGGFDFAAFLQKYGNRFFVPKSVVSRLSHHDYGIVNTSGEFRFRYMYYYFLGRYLANNKEATKTIVEELCERSYVRDNQIVILFLVHHTNDDEALLSQQSYRIPL